MYNGTISLIAVVTVDDPAGRFGRMAAGRQYHLVAIETNRLCNDCRYRRDHNGHRLRYWVRRLILSHNWSNSFDIIITIASYDLCQLGGRVTLTVRRFSLL